MGTTLAEKVWADHLVRKGSDGAPDLLYIDLMLMHEVTSPQAFEGLRLAGRPLGILIGMSPIMVRARIWRIRKFPEANSGDI